MKRNILKALGLESIEGGTDGVDVVEGGEQPAVDETPVKVQQEAEVELPALTEEEQTVAEDMPAAPESTDEVLEVVDACPEEAGETVNEEMEEQADAYDEVGADIEAAQDVVDVLEASGEEGAEESTLALADAALERIFSKYGTPMKKYALESVHVGRPQATLMAIESANARIAALEAGMFDGFANTVTRMKVNFRNAVQFASTWAKEVKEVEAQIQQIAPDAHPTEGAFYTNRVRVAHFTTGDKKTVSSAKELVKNIKEGYAASECMLEIAKAFVGLYKWASKPTGKFDFDAVANKLSKSKFMPGKLSLTGSSAFFGEEFVVTPFGGKVENLDELMTVISGIEVSEAWAWRVNELEQPSLPPLPASQLKGDAQALVSAGQGVKKLFDEFNGIVGVLSILKDDKGFAGLVADAIGAEKGHIRKFRGAYYRTLNAFFVAMDHALNNNAKAQSCYLDYVKWSIKQYK